MSNVLTQTIVYLLLLFIGYAFKRAGIFKIEDSNFLKSVILYITMPAAAVNGMKDLELQTSFLWCFLIGFATCSLLMAVGMFVSRKSDASGKLLYLFSFNSFNVGNFAIPFLTGRDITVVTNGISHINQLINLEIPCILIGGSIKKTTNACIGPLTETTLKTFYFNKCFLGASGFSIPSGITNHDINERVIKLIALHNSSQPYFLLDHTKYGIVTMVQVADLDAYPILIDEIPKGLEGYSNFILCE